MTDSTQLNRELGVAAVLWKLDDLYASPGCTSFSDDCQWCRDQAQAIKKEYHSRVAALSADELLVLVNRLEALECRLGKLLSYSFLHFTTQIDNEAAGALYQQVQELANDCRKQSVFFELEWNNISQEKADRLLQDRALLPYKHYLASLRRYHPHQLPEAEEKLLIELKSVGRKSWTTLFEKVIGNLRFGAAKRSEEEVLNDLYHPDRGIRKQAADDLTQGLQSQGHILTHIYNTLAADKMVSDRLRCYRYWVSSMNLDNQIADHTVETLIDAVTSRYDLVSRYYHLKRSLLGLETLYDYDRYAPLPSLPTARIDWNSCREIILGSFADFSPELAAIAEQFFLKSWIHAPVRQGKRGGAFAHPCVPEVHPYLMVNYTGTHRDVSTVAHELGHGVHQVLASKKGYFNSETPLTLAETASVFAEFLVFKAQLKIINKPEEKRAFICQKLESVFATVFRQVAMNRFENLMHQGRRNRGELSSDDLSSSWMQTQQEMFGNGVVLREDYRIWWSYIPHFLNVPGYVYSYAFGELLVLCLYDRYQQEGDSFVEKYRSLLSAGGSAPPDDLLGPFSIDLNDPSFWHQGLSVIEEILAEVENG